MNQDEIRQRIADIERYAADGDNEAAHGVEDGLYVGVLHAIARGAGNPAELAAAALLASAVKYDRRYA